MRWTEETAIAAVRRWAIEKNHGISPRQNEWMPTPKGCPSSWTLCRLFDTWNEAMEAAGFTPRPSHVSNGDHVGNGLLQLRVDNGETLTEIAGEIGITPQALGRRLARYRAKHPDVNHRVPEPANRNPLTRR